MNEDWLKNKNNQMEEFLIDTGAATKDKDLKFKKNENSEESANCQKDLFV